METAHRHRDAMRRRIGGVGVWGLGLQSAANERHAAVEIERLGYGALWFGEGPDHETFFLRCSAACLSPARRFVAGIMGR
jgi:hypothetical protein